MQKDWKFTGLACLLGCLLGCARAVSAPAVSHDVSSARYEVTIHDNFDGARVQACFDGFAPHHLSPIDGDAARSMVRAWSKDGALGVHAGQIAMTASTKPICVWYETRFANAVFRTRDSRAVVVSQAEWLWRPDPLPADLDASVSVVLPSGAKASLPWESDGATYRLNEDAFHGSAYNVFGVFDEQRFSVGRIAVTVARLGPRPGDEAVFEWLTRAIGAVESVGSELPTQRLHFVVVPVEGMYRPVAFGMVRRGGGVSVLLIPSSTAKADDLAGDWVAIHELSHLWLPRLQRQDRWLSEGIATYLQEVLRARCGLQSSAVSWARVRDGLDRGRRSGTGRILASESRDMNRTGAYHRVYWAGTAFALEADFQLRRESEGEMTLLRLLALAQPQISSLRDPVDAEQLLSVLDDVGGSDFLVELGASYASSVRFPDTRLLDEPRNKRIRDSIMAREPDRCISATAEPSR